MCPVVRALYKCFIQAPGLVCGDGEDASFMGSNSIDNI